jgi:hypothetical protein
VKKTLIPGVIVGATAILLAMLIFDGRQIGACARDAEVLSGVADQARERLHGDVDSFLGRGFVQHKEDALQALDGAYRAAENSANRASSVLLSGSARLAREIFLAAKQQRNLVAEPRGTWTAYVEESARAKGAYEAARDRFNLEASIWVSGEGSAEVRNALRAALARLTAAVEKDQRDADAALRAANAEQAAKVRARAAAVENAARQRDANRGPDRDVSGEDFEWSWRDGRPPSVVIRFGEGKKVGPGRTEILTWKNRTSWRMYDLTIGFEGLQNQYQIAEIGPGEVGERELQTNSPEPMRPRPIFRGTFRGPPIPRSIAPD